MTDEKENRTRIAGADMVAGHVADKESMRGSQHGADLAVHVLGHPDLPLDVPGAPADAQVLNCHHFCLLLSRARVPFVYYGVSGSRVPPGGEFADIGSGDERWTYASARHCEYNTRLSKTLRDRVRARSEPRQILCSLYGAAQADIDDLGLPVVEPMVGYDHCWAPYRVFPSYAQQHVIYTVQADDVRDTRWFDTVIPHFVNPDDFPLGDSPDDYALYLGRNAEDKGIGIAEDVCAAAGVPLKKVHEGYSGSRKAELIGSARVVLMPTLYLEPFGYVAVEAQMCGTPVVTTDWGAFVETVAHGVSGYRCRTQAEFLWALQHVDSLDRTAIRQRALRKYSVAAVTDQYLDYFDFVWNVHVNGGYYARDAVRYSFRVAKTIDD